MTPAQPSFTVLSVEDNPSDTAMLRLFFTEADPAPDFRSVPDAEGALDYLYRRNGFESAPRPSLVLLDLNLPRMNGRELLRRIRCDDYLRSIPVVVLTTSNSPRERRECYEAGANAFLTKPMDLEGFEKLVHGVVAFWASNSSA